MALKAPTFETVRKMGLALPDVEVDTAYGSPALKVRGKMFACLAIHRSAEPGSLVVRLDFAQREELMAADPDTYYVTDHYADYPAMLVRLPRVHPDALRDLLLMAWRFVSANGNATGAASKRLPWEKHEKDEGDRQGRELGRVGARIIWPASGRRRSTAGFRRATEQIGSFSWYRWVTASHADSFSATVVQPRLPRNRWRDRRHVCGVG